MGLPATSLAQAEPTQRAEVTLEQAYQFACRIDPVVAPPEPGAQASLTADEAGLAENGEATATGSVRLEKDGQALEASDLSYNRKTSRVRAANGLRYYRPGINLAAETADVNINQQTGTFGNTQFALTENGGRGHAEQIESLGPGLFELRVSDYSTCPGETKAWRLSAKRIELDQEEGRGEAFGAVLSIFDLPIFYTPYLNFPIDDQRHSGLLLPVVGLSGRSGFELATPYYINIAPDRDATITPRLLTKRGFQLGGEFRYLNPHSVGHVAGEYLPGDSEFGDDRSLLQFEHLGRFGQHFGVDAQYTRVSDDEYFQDLGNNISTTSRSQLERALELSFAATGVRLSALVQNFQTLEDNRRTQSFRLEPYERLPQVQLSAKSPTAPWHVGLDAQFSNFQRDDSVDGTRYDVQPLIGLGKDLGFWYGRSQASYRYTQYNLRDTQPGTDDSLDRQIPSFSAETGLRFERLMGNGWLQTLEPRAFYLYNGFDSQDDLPVFDTGIPDLRYDRLFASNRFIGRDRIGDANQVTLGLTSRFIDPEDGRTVVKLDVGRIYGFNPIDVRLPQRAPIGFGERHSDIVTNAEYSPQRNLFTSFTLQYDPDDSRVNRGGVRAGYRDDAGRRLDLGYRYYRDFRAALVQAPGGQFETLEQTDFIVELPVYKRLKVFGRWNYSLERSQSVQTLAGLEYRPSCCWAVRGAYQRFIRNEQGDYDTGLLFQIELTGLGRFGENIERLLERDTVDIDTGFNGFLYP